MTCCASSLRLQHGAGAKITYAPGKGFSFTDLTPLLRIWQGDGNADSPLLEVGLTETPKGSRFVLADGSLLLEITKDDAGDLPVADDLFFDITLTDLSGFVSPFLGGAVEVDPDGSRGPSAASGSVMVALNGLQVPVVIQGGSLGPAMSAAMADLNAAVSAAETAAGEAETAKNETLGQIDTRLAKTADLDDLADKEAATGNLLFLQSGTGAESRSVRDKLRDVVSVKDTGAVGDGTTADEDAFQAALDQGGSIFLPNTTYKIDSQLTADGDLHLHGPAVLDFSGGGSLVIGGGVTRIADLGADISVEDYDITFASAHGLVAGDVLVVWNPTDYSQAPYRDYYRAGDMFRVASVQSSTVVRIFGKAREAHAATNVQCFKLNSANVTLENIEIIPRSDGVKPIFIDGADGVRLDRPKIRDGASGTGVEIFRCFDVHVNDPQATVTSGSDAYPVVISNSQNVIVSYPTGNNSSWHCVALGGRDGDGSVPTSDVKVIGGILMNVQMGVGGADVHGGCKNVEYINCTSYGGVSLGGFNVAFRGCIIYGRSTDAFADGLVVYAPELVGGHILFDDGCVFRTEGNGVNFGLHHFELEQITRDTRLELRGTMFSKGSGAASARPIRLDVGDTTPPTAQIDVHIGLTYDGVKPFCGVIVNGANDVSGNCTITIEPGFPTSLGANLFIATAAANNNIPLVLPYSAGWAADTGTAKKTSSATYTAGSAITAPTGGATIDAESRTAIGTLIARMASVEAALQNTSQGQKAIKDALLSQQHLVS